MKRIWRESKDAGRFIVRCVGRNEYVYNATTYVSTLVIAWWDKGTGTLRIECKAFNSDEQDNDWMPLPCTYLETVNEKENAFRRVVRVADEWFVAVQSVIPGDDARTDAEVIAADKAKKTLYQDDEAEDLSY